jgi:hypothetical protein
LLKKLLISVLLLLFEFFYCGNGQEDTGRNVDTTEMENKTSGTGLTTTKKWEFAIESIRKKKGHEIAVRRAKEWKSRKE